MPPFLMLLSLLLSVQFPVSSASIPKPACDVCMETIREADKLVQANGTIVDIEKVATIVCELVKAGGECPGRETWQCQQVCELAVQTYEPMVDALVLRYLDPHLVCYNVRNNTFGCSKPPPPPDPTPVPNMLVDNATRPVFNNSQRFGYLLQIPDLHWDQQYVEGSVANCGEPLCCRPYDNDHNYSTSLLYGGRFGIANESVLCDTPKSVITSMIDFIASDIIEDNADGIDATNLDAIIFVGDAQAHDVYNQSQEQHLQLMQDWIGLLRDGLDKFDIPVFFSLGNHEGLPVDNFGGPPIDDWFNGPTAQWLAQWIDTEHSVEYDSHRPSDIFASSGYYSSLIRPGLRLISINTGFVTTGNFYLTFTQYDDPYVDMGGQLKWLNATLWRAKHELHEAVILVQHHPMTSMLSQFEQSYYALYEQYSDVIVTILAGHTHVDQYHVLGDNNFSDPNTKPWATWFSPGSVVQYGGRNPAFRVYKYDRNTMAMENYFQYRFDTARSNDEMEPYWFKAHDACSEYGLEDVSAASMSGLAYKLLRNDTLWDRYQYNYYNGVPHDGDLNRNATVCNLLSATHWQDADCKQHVAQSDLSVEQFEEMFY